jgi:hypothetical protein
MKIVEQSDSDVFDEDDNLSVHDSDGDVHEEGNYIYPFVDQHEVAIQ